ncbi:MAG: tRNA 4-thiouridine(8) synthase ThiI [Deltaproteobacteria bacterium RIFCSPHIGHO2_02_FULL_40_11]|nr:MAG: tRNA 4-thiouridine(8) synthase ThiI [Deltaproteobacteria bacterium RIFCSPHIGHO2_02_FULL_40_11]
MKYNGVLIRYNELALKGKNRIYFEKKLISNIQRKLPEAEIQRLWGRIFVGHSEVRRTEESHFIPALQKIFGISSFSPIVKVNSDLKTIQEESLNLVMAALETETASKISFRVNTNRADKSFPSMSPQINQAIAQHILPKTKRLEVDLKNAKLELGIEIREEGTFLYASKIKGLGGLPLGTSGRVLTLLSGGIDSPVAAWMMMKRGCPTDFIHYYGYPYTGEQSKQKVIQLFKKVCEYQNEAKLFIVPFGKIQEEIQKNCAERYRTLLYRRFMQQIATHVAETQNALALVTGESIGQVASQTLENLTAVRQITPIEIMRPLIAFDKHETIQLAKTIETYDISIQPFDDCCTLFQPLQPATRSRHVDLLKEEEKLDAQALIQAALATVETVENF